MPWDRSPPAVNDQQLLRAYVQQKTDEAFAELVRRHQHMVYSTCLRKLQNPEYAQDAAQQTFLLLVQKAAGLQQHPCLGGWLYKAALLQARALLKKETYRQHFLQAMSENASHQLSEPVDERLEGLDEALLELREGDRHALVLRFFEGRSLREISEMVGTTEEAARKRVARALEQLTRRMHRRTAVAGLTAMSVATAMSEATQAAPTSFLTDLATSARHTRSLAEAATTAIATKLKIAGLCALAATVPLTFQWRENRRLVSEITALKTELSTPLRNAPASQLSFPSLVPLAKTTDPLTKSALESAIGALLFAETLQADGTRLAKLTAQVQLTDAQQAAAAEAQRQARQVRADGIAQLVAGKTTLAAVKGLLQADLNAAEAFRTVLQPTQLPAYEQFLAAEAAAFAEANASSELARLHGLLNLTEMQKDAIFEVLTAQTPSLLSFADVSITSLEQLRQRWNELQEEQAAAFETILEEPQRLAYHQQAAVRRAFVDGLLTVPADAAVVRCQTKTAQNEIVTLPVPEAKGTVLIFSSTTCPIANGFAPELTRLEKEFHPSGIVFLLVQVETDLTAPQALKHAQEYGFTWPVLLDPQHQLSKTAGATVTPEAVVLSPEGAVLYRGRIDDRFRSVGQRWSEPRHSELRDALEALLAGRTIINPLVPAEGCLIE